MAPGALHHFVELSLRNGQGFLVGEDDVKAVLERLQDQRSGFCSGQVSQDGLVQGKWPQLFSQQLLRMSRRSLELSVGRLASRVLELDQTLERLGPKSRSVEL